jgi:hypothetical protein
MTPAQEIASLKLQVRQLRKALEAFIVWTAQSANSPIRPDEAAKLLNVLGGTDDL